MPFGIVNVAIVDKHLLSVAR